MHDVAAETNKTSSEGRSRFDAVAKWMGRSPLVVSTEGRLCRQAGIQGLPKLAPEERRVLVQARCPDHKRPVEPPQAPHASPVSLFFCTLCNLQIHIEKRMKIFREERCRGTGDYTLKRREPALAGEGQVQRAIAGRADAGRRRATGEKRLVQDMSGAKRWRARTAEER